MSTRIKTANAPSARWSRKPGRASASSRATTRSAATNLSPAFAPPRRSCTTRNSSPTPPFAPTSTRRRRSICRSDNKARTAMKRTSALFALALLLAVGSPAAAAQPAADSFPCPQQIAALATCYSAKLPSGALVLAAVPKNWNQNLIVYAHGGPGPMPPTNDLNSRGLARYSIEVKLGYAWVGTTYRYLGFAVQQSADDTDEARQYFVDHFGKPKRTILHGASYGGLVGAMLIERYAKNYDGAFFNSGMLAGAIVGYQFRADLRAVYQYYCKNLPRPDEKPYPIW